MNDGVPESFVMIRIPHGYEAEDRKIHCQLDRFRPEFHVEMYIIAPRYLTSCEIQG